LRKLTFREPSFVCEVERAGSRSTRLEYGDTKQQVRQRLLDRNYIVHTVKEYKFTTWRALAEKTRKTFTLNKPYTFKKEVWTAVKQYLYALSNDLCGYCEALVFVTNDGEVEHYRPKSAVDGDGTHPGYYWLAYDFDNYVPTCHKCNTGKGKRNQFPIKGKRVRKPGGKLALERPLLLHPFKHNPADHLNFLVPSADGKFSFGCVAGRDEIGKTSVQVYQLNREHLTVDRQQALETLRVELLQSWWDAAKRARLIEQITSGNRPYASTCLAYLQVWLDEQRADAKRLQKEIQRAAVGTAVKTTRRKTTKSSPKRKKA
jgi:hypothetical protein